MIDKKTGLRLREGTVDFKEITNTKRYKILKDVAGKTVMDCGANIGCFTYWALKHGAKKVVAYEPMPYNIEMWKKQGFDNRAELIEAAIYDKYGKISMYDGATKKHPSAKYLNTSASSLDLHKGWDSIEVNCVSFIDEVLKWKPDCVKLDIEGAEYLLDYEALPDFVKSIQMEIHINSSHSEKDADRLINRLKKYIVKGKYHYLFGKMCTVDLYGYNI